MKKLIFSCAVLLLGYKSSAQEIRIPFTIQNGYGPFYRTISTITGKKPNNEQQPKGIPENLDSAQLRVIAILPHQYQYQSLFAARVKKELPGNWAARVKKEKLTEKEIKCFLNIVSGINKITGKPEVIIDKNHNGDFSDDTAFTPASSHSFKDERTMERAALPITFERYDGKRIITEKARLLVSINSRGMIMFNYTVFYLAPQEKLVIARPLYEYDELLEDYGFIRCHNSYLVNRNFIKSILKEDGGSLLLENNTQLPISRQKKELIKRALLKK